MYECPFPGCQYVAAHAILNSHAKSHGYVRVSEMTKEHGPVKRINPNPKAVSYARATTVDIKESSFNNIESAMSRMKNTNRGDLRIKEN